MNDAEIFELLLSGTPLIDVRAPIEFQRGSIPGSLNLPLLENEERAAVGITYKTEGPEAAVALGHRLVSGDLREKRIAAWVSFARENPKAWIYCFRGGMRSQLTQGALREVGVGLPIVAGGYKRMRNLLASTIVTQ